MAAPMDLGAAMWRGIAPTFRVVAHENKVKSPEERALMWTGFAGAMAGAIGADLGQLEARVLLAAVICALDFEAPHGPAH
jgi:hypothetical protein